MTWQLLSLTVICLAVAYAASFPHGLMQFVLTGNEVWLFLAGCCIWPGGILILATDLVARTFVCILARRFAATNARWYLAFFLAGACVWAGTTDWLLRWRFSGNRPVLESAAKTLLQSAASAPSTGGVDLDWPFAAFNWYGKTVGDYSVRQVAVFPNEDVVFLTTRGFFRSAWGFLYDPHGKVAGPLMQPTRLVDGWSTFKYSKE